MSNSTAVERFDFNGSEIRVFILDGEPWFVARDVATVLGYRDSSNATRILRDREIRTHQVSTSAGLRESKLINEQGLYRLVMRSEREEAEVFQDWVTGEVLPSIRKTGGYSVVSGTPSSTEMLRQQVAAQLATIDQMIEIERKVDAERGERLALAERVDRLEVTHDRVAAIGFAALRKIRTDVAYLNRLGRAAAGIARRDGVPVERVHSTIWGEVNAWPLEVWDEALDQIGE